MIPKTLTELITEVRVRGEFRENYYPDAELTYYLNSGLTSVRALIQNMDPAYYIHSQIFATVAGVNAYQVEDNATSINRVEVYDSRGQDNWVQLDSFAVKEQGDKFTSASRIDWRWRFPGEQTIGSTYPNYANSTIVIYPTPQEVVNIRVWFVSHPELGDGTLQGGNPPTIANWYTETYYFDFMGEKEYIILKALIIAGIKEESPMVSGWQMLLKEKEKEIILSLKAQMSKPSSVKPAFSLSNVQTRIPDSRIGIKY